MNKKKVTKTTKKVFTRPPIVTVMGHVDHGKTTLLDAIRQTNEAGKEFGGITQTIGAYQIEYKAKEGLKKITFIDTPGHEAFSEMRARGAKVTDIVVLVVAADDGVKPQTVEAIKHARAANVPIIVAINKIDVEGADPKKVKRELMKEGVITEDLGGDTVSVLVSAKQKQGINELLEMVLIVSEMLELSADPNVPFTGVVIESHMDSRKGPLASLIVKEGTLKVGQVVACEGVSGKIKALMNEWGKPLDSAGPSTPVEVIGFRSLPPLGAAVTTLLDIKEDEVEAVAAPILPKKELELADLFASDTKKPGITVLVKSDSEGSLEAVLASLNRLNSEQFELRIIHSGVGEVNRSDALLAKASGALIVSFRVKFPPTIERMARDEKILIRTYQIIYELIDEIEEALWGEVTDEIKEKILGRAEVIGLFASTMGKTIAGCRVTEGRLAVNDRAKVYRKEVEITTGKIKTIKHLKEEVREVKKDKECGLTIDPDFDFKKGDIIEIVKG